MGLDPEQLLDLAVRPALDTMGVGFNGVAAEQLVMGTAAVESGLCYLRQLGFGPALGLWQMEPFTFNDLIKRAGLRVTKSLNQLSIGAQEDPFEVAWNLRFGAAMCRLKYKDARPKLPAPFDIDHMERYHKKYYNSVLGKTRPGEFVQAWQSFIAPHAERMWP